MAPYKGIETALLKEKIRSKALLKRFRFPQEPEESARQL
jgi:hypothetical protein